MRSRQKIMEATLGLIEAKGFDAVNMASVAAAAGVSRQTVYSIFGSREDLVSQVIIGLATELVTNTQARLAATVGACEYVVELIIIGRSQIRDHAVLGRLLRVGTGNPVFDEGMMRRATPVATQLLQPLLQRDPGLADRLDDIVEMVTRIALSVMLFDSDATNSDDALRAFLTRWLSPSLS